MNNNFRNPSTIKNTSIEALRFFMMVIICCWHNYASAGIFTHGYLAVEFFFILSGWLLYNSFSKENARSTIDYSWNKFKRFAPEYLIVMAYIYLRHGILPVLVGNRELDSDFLMHMLPEALLLQDCGVYLGGANAPLWYLSILLIGGGLIYSILRYNARLAINILLPFLCLMGFTYIFGKSTNGSIEVWDVDNGIKATMVRGMADMSLGVLLSYVFKLKGDVIKKHLTTINLSSMICFVYIAYIVLSAPYYDRYILIVIPPVILACFTKQSMINKVFCSRIWTVLGGMTFEMLLLHFRVAMPILETLRQNMSMPMWGDYIVYLTIVIVLSFALKIINDRLRQWQLFQ